MSTCFSDTQIGALSIDPMEVYFAPHICIFLGASAVTFASFHFSWSFFSKQDNHGSILFRSHPASFCSSEAYGIYLFTFHERLGKLRISRLFWVLPSRVIVARPHLDVTNTFYIGVPIFPLCYCYAARLTVYCLSSSPLLPPRDFLFSLLFLFRL